MTVLVVGSHAAEAVAGALRQAGARVEHASPELAVARLAAVPEGFALVLAERQGGACADRRLRDGIAGTGAMAPVWFLTPPEQAEHVAPAGAPGAPPPICAIEQTANGPRLLRCALAQARARPAGQNTLDDALNSAVGETPHVFAYCAPTRRGG